MPGLSRSDRNAIVLASLDHRAPALTDASSWVTGSALPSADPTQIRLAGITPDEAYPRLTEKARRSPSGASAICPSLSPSKSVSAVTVLACTGYAELRFWIHTWLYQSGEYGSNFRSSLIDITLLAHQRGR